MSARADGKYTHVGLPMEEALRASQWKHHETPVDINVLGDY